MVAHRLGKNQKVWMLLVTFQCCHAVFQQLDSVLYVSTVVQLKLLMSFSQLITLPLLNPNCLIVLHHNKTLGRTATKELDTFPPTRKIRAAIMGSACSINSTRAALPVPR